MRWWNRKISAGIDLSTVVRVVEEIPELRVTLVIAMAKAAHGVTDKEGVMGVLGAGAVTLTLRVGARKGTVAEGGSGRCRLPLPNGGETQEEGGGMGEASGEGAIYPGGGARESLNGLCGEVEMTVHGKPQVMRAHPHRSEGRTEGGNEGVEGGGIVGGRGREAKERLRDANP